MPRIEASTSAKATFQLDLLASIKTRLFGVLWNFLCCELQRHDHKLSKNVASCYDYINAIKISCDNSRKYWADCLQRQQACKDLRQSQPRLCHAACESRSIYPSGCDHHLWVLQFATFGTYLLPRL